MAEFTDEEARAYFDRLIRAAPETARGGVISSNVSIGEDIDNFMRGAAQGLSLSTADKVVAGGRALFGDGNYADNVREEQKRTETAYSRSPIASRAGYWGGNLLLGARMGKPGYLPATRQGAIAGGLTGAGEAGPGMGETGLGGALGAAFGGAAAPLGVAGMDAITKIAPALIPDFIKNAIPSFAGRKVAQAVGRDGLTAEQAAARMRELGPDATLADVGPNTRMLGEAVVNQPGKSAATAEKVLTDRQKNARVRLDAAVDNAVGGNKNLYTETTKLIEDRATAARPLYEKAYEMGPVYNDRINEFLQDPVMKQGLKEGIEIQRLEALANNQRFKPVDLAITGFDDAGDPILGNVPNMRTLDTVKKGLDQMLEQYRDKTTGKLVLDTRGEAINKVRKAFLNEIDSVNPDYKAAREAWAGPSAALNAVAKGREALTNDPEVTAKIVKGLSPADKEFYQVGLARALKDKIHNTGDTADATKRIFGNAAMRDKIRAAFDKDAAFDQFEKVMQAEQVFIETYRNVLKNSATARRMMAQEDMNMDPSALVELMQGNFKGAAQGFVKSLANRANKIPEGQSNQIGNLLFRQGKQSETLDELKKRMIMEAMLQNTKNMRTGMTALGSGVAAGRQGNELLNE